MQRQTTNPALKRLDALVGEWEMAASVGGMKVDSGRAVFEWREGESFLVQHANAEPATSAPPEWAANSPFPVVTIIGLDKRDGQPFVIPLHEKPPPCPAGVFHGGD